MSVLYEYMLDLGEGLGYLNYYSSCVFSSRQVCVNSLASCLSCFWWSLFFDFPWCVLVGIVDRGIVYFLSVNISLI